MIGHDDVAPTKDEMYERYQSTVGFWKELEVDGVVQPDYGLSWREYWNDCWRAMIDLYANRFNFFLVKAQPLRKYPQEDVSVEDETLSWTKSLTAEEAFQWVTTEHWVRLHDVPGRPRNNAWTYTRQSFNCAECGVVHAVPGLFVNRKAYGNLCAYGHGRYIFVDYDLRQLTPTLEKLASLTPSVATAKGWMFVCLEPFNERYRLPEGFDVTRQDNNEVLLPLSETCEFCRLKDFRVSRCSSYRKRRFHIHAETETPHSQCVYRFRNWYNSDASQILEFSDFAKQVVN